MKNLFDDRRPRLSTLLIYHLAAIGISCNVLWTMYTGRLTGYSVIEVFGLVSLLFPVVYPFDQSRSLPILAMFGLAGVFPYINQGVCHDLRMMGCTLVILSGCLFPWVSLLTAVVYSRYKRSVAH